MKNNKKKLSSYNHLFAGIVGGTIETFINMPLITYKFNSQNNNPMPKNILGWYKGIIPQVSTVAPITAFQMTTNNILTKYYSNNLQNSKTNQISNQYKIGIACLSGTLSSLLYTPVDFITIYQQKTKLSITESTIGVYQNFGLVTFYKGLFPCAVREMICTGGYIGVAPILSNYINNNYIIDKNYSIILGSTITGTLCCILSNPFDVVKTIIQSNYNIQSNYENNTFRLLKLIIKNDKLYNNQNNYCNNFLFKGCIPRIFRLSGAFIILNYTQIFLF